MLCEATECTAEDYQAMWEWHYGAIAKPAAANTASWPLLPCEKLLAPPKSLQCASAAVKLDKRVLAQFESAGTHAHGLLGGQT